MEEHFIKGVMFAIYFMTVHHGQWTEPLELANETGITKELWLKLEPPEEYGTTEDFMQTEVFKDLRDNNSNDILSGLDITDDQLPF